MGLYQLATECQTLGSEPKSDTNGKTLKKLSFCPFCLYNGSNDILYMNHIMSRHYCTAYGCGKCLKEVFLSDQQLKLHLRVCTGLPKGDTTSSSDKEPAPEDALESSQDSPHHSQCVKKKLDSTKESSSHSKVHKSHKKSKHPKEGTPKKEKWDKVDKHKSKKSHKKFTFATCTPLQSIISEKHMPEVAQTTSRNCHFLVIAFNHFSLLSTFHYSCIFL